MVGGMLAYLLSVAGAALSKEVCLPSAAFLSSAPSGGTWQRGYFPSAHSLPSAVVRAFDKESVCRVPDIMHLVKYATLVKKPISVLLAL